MLNLTDSLEKRCKSFINYEIRPTVKPTAPQLSPDEISKFKARIAARAALNDMIVPPKQRNRASSFALYTWGGLAVMSAAVAITIGLVPSDSERSSQLVASVSHGNSSDLPSVAGIQFPELPAATVVASKDQEQLLEDRPELDATTTAAIAPEEFAPAPVAVKQVSGSEALGVDIGGSNSIPVLSARFKALQKRSPELFAGLNPLVRFSETKGQLDARLIAGPFETSNQLAEFCRSVRLQLTLDCKQTGYQGDPIKLDK